MRVCVCRQRVHPHTTPPPPQPSQSCSSSHLVIVRCVKHCSSTCITIVSTIAFCHYHQAHKHHCYSQHLRSQHGDLLLLLLLLSSSRNSSSRHISHSNDVYALAMVYDSKADPPIPPKRQDNRHPDDKRPIPWSPPNVEARPPPPLRIPISITVQIMKDGQRDTIEGTTGDTLLQAIAQSKFANWVPALCRGGGGPQVLFGSGPR